jgi:hypothetical protein
MRKWRAGNPLSPEQKVKAAARSRKWRQSNKEHNSAYQKAYRAANREKLNAQQLVYKARRKRAAALQKPAVI